MKDENIFDLENVDDLPEELKNISKIKRRNNAYKVLSLFLIKEPLSIPEIIVGLYRKYKTESTQLKTRAVIFELVKKNLLESKGWGEYILTSDGRKFSKEEDNK